MIEAQLNMFDVVVIVVLLLSTILAFFRGFVREVLSLGAWVGAAVVTIYAFEPVANMLKEHTSRDVVAYFLAGVGTYIVTLFSISLFNALIIRYVKSGAEVGMLDNFLGLMFGGLRGLFIVSLGYLVLSLVIDAENPPEWVEQAQTKPIAQQGAIVLANIAPGYLEDISSLRDTLKGQQEEDGEDEEEPKTVLDSVIEEGDYLFGGKKREEKGYSSKERQQLENVYKSR